MKFDIDHENDETYEDEIYTRTDSYTFRFDVQDFTRWPDVSDCEITVTKHDSITDQGDTSTVSYIESIRATDPLGGPAKLTQREQGLLAEDLFTAIKETEFAVLAKDWQRIANLTKGRTTEEAKAAGSPW